MIVLIFWTEERLSFLSSPEGPQQFSLEWVHLPSSPPSALPQAFWMWVDFGSMIIFFFFFFPSFLFFLSRMCLGKHCGEAQHSLSWARKVKTVLTGQPQLSAVGELFCLFYICFLLIKMSFLIKNEMSRRKKNWQSLDYCNECEQKKSVERKTLKGWELYLVHCFGRKKKKIKRRLGEVLVPFVVHGAHAHLLYTMLP